jgi:hypothetical protein
MTIVRDGLALQERVVTSNQYRLQAGTPVHSTPVGSPAAASTASAS